MRFLALSVAACVIGVISLILVIVYYGPANVFAFELSENEGRVVSVGGIVQSVFNSSSWRAYACDSSCFYVVAPAALAARMPVLARVGKGTAIVAVGFVSSDGGVPQVVLGGEDSLRVVP